MLRCEHLDCKAIPLHTLTQTPASFVMASIDAAIDAAIDVNAAIGPAVISAVVPAAVDVPVMALVAVAVPAIAVAATLLPPPPAPFAPIIIPAVAAVVAAAGDPGVVTAAAAVAATAALAATALALASSGSSDGGEEVDVARSLHVDDQTLDACPWLSVRRDTRKEGDDAAGPAPADEARLLLSAGRLRASLSAHGFVHLTAEALGPLLRRDALVERLARGVTRLVELGHTSSTICVFDEH